ncbi:MAG: hypothetical protein ACE5OR_04740 [bacterium]
MDEKIITHDDFDGLICATICSHVLGIEEVQFVGPRTVTEARITITERDVVCDLPYPLECGMWFDHHEGNLEEVRYRGIDPAAIEGRFEPKDSCARVVFEYFTEKGPLPARFAPMVDEADMIDSFNYTSIDDWRRETPGKIIDSALKLQRITVHQRWDFLRHLISLLKEHPIDVVAARREVRERYVQFQQEEEAMLEQIRRDITFLSEDTDHRLVILDLTHHKRQPKVLKNLAYLLYPEAEGIIEVKNMFRHDRKTNDLSFSVSLSLNLKSIEHNKDVGDIMRRLNIGSGHKGAGAGTVRCSSKNEMLRKKKEILRQIVRTFQSQ